MAVAMCILITSDGRHLANRFGGGCRRTVPGVGITQLREPPFPGCARWPGVSVRRGDLASILAQPAMSVARNPCLPLIGDRFLSPEGYRRSAGIIVETDAVSYKVHSRRDGRDTLCRRTGHELTVPRIDYGG